MLLTIYNEENRVTFMQHYLKIINPLKRGNFHKTNISREYWRGRCGPEVSPKRWLNWPWNSRKDEKDLQRWRRWAKAVRPDVEV